MRTFTLAFAVAAAATLAQAQAPLRAPVPDPRPMTKAEAASLIAHAGYGAIHCGATNALTVALDRIVERGVWIDLYKRDDARLLRAAADAVRLEALDLGHPRWCRKYFGAPS